MEIEKRKKELPPEIQFNEKQLEGIFQLFAVNGNALVEREKNVEKRWRASALKSIRAFRYGIASDGGEKCGTGSERENETVTGRGSFPHDVSSSFFPPLSSMSALLPAFRTTSESDGKGSSDSRSPTQLRVWMLKLSAKIDGNWCRRKKSNKGLKCQCR